MDSIEGTTRLDPFTLGLSHVNMFSEWQYDSSRKEKKEKSEYRELSDKWQRAVDEAVERMENEGEIFTPEVANKYGIQAKSLRNSISQQGYPIYESDDGATTGLLNDKSISDWMERTLQVDKQQEDKSKWLLHTIWGTYKVSSFKEAAQKVGMTKTTIRKYYYGIHKKPYWYIDMEEIYTGEDE